MPRRDQKISAGGRGRPIHGVAPIAGVLPPCEEKAASGARQRLTGLFAPFIHGDALGDQQRLERAGRQRRHRAAVREVDIERRAHIG